MKLLLDTNVLIWFALSPKRLGPAATTAIKQAESCYLSSVSVFEITLKTMTTSLQFPTDLDPVVTALDGEYLPLQPTHARAIEQFPDLAHHDPFDRLLLAQAHIEDLELLTANEYLLSLGFDFVRDATK